MGAENWILKTQNGEEWGLIKRLIIDSATRQISYADVIVMETGRLVRIPWDSVLVQREGITLSAPEKHIQAPTVSTHGTRPADTLAMEVWS
jgi:hypothetical protein